MLDSTTPGGELNGPPTAPLLMAGPAAPVRNGHVTLWGAAALLIVIRAGGGWWFWQSHRPSQQAQAAPPTMKVPAITVVARRMSRSQVFEGSLISVAGTTLNTLVQLDPIYVSFNPAESNLSAINQTQAQAPIETAAAVGGGTRTHDGTVTFIANTVDRTTGTIMLRATIANPNRGLLPGQFVTARLHLGNLDNALLVPQSAVGSGQTGRFLMIVSKDGKVEQHVVKLSDSDGDMIVVTDGLAAGDRVITGQLQKLKPGTPVEVAEPAAETAK